MRVKLAIGSVAGFVVAGLALAVLLFMGSPTDSPAVFVVGLVLGILGLVGGIIAGVFGVVLPLFGGKASFVTPDQYSQIAAEGRSGFARVLSARPTGAQLNGAYAYRAELVVDQTGVPVYKTTDVIRIPRTDGVLRPNDVISVVRLSQDKPNVSAIAGPSRVPQDTPVPHDALPWS